MFVCLCEQKVPLGGQIRWLQLSPNNQSEDLTVTWGWWCGGVQVDRAQRLQGNIDVVDVVKDHGLLLQGLVG